MIRRQNSALILPNSVKTNFEIQPGVNVRRTEFGQNTVLDLFTRQTRPIIHLQNLGEHVVFIVYGYDIVSF